MICGMFRLIHIMRSTAFISVSLPVCLQSVSKQMLY